MSEDLERLKQHVPLLEYLQRHHWGGHRVGAGPHLAQRGVHDAKLIEELGIGYARGGNLRPHLQALGHSLDLLHYA